MLIIHGIDDLIAHAGADLGATDWREVTQEQVNTFADVTDDHQWIHVDVERAAATPFGGTIAHGFLTLSLLSGLQAQLIDIQGITHALNYGLDRVRFPAPAKVGQSLRLRAEITKVDPLPGGAQVTFTDTIEVQGGEKPVCVAVFLTRVYGPSAATG